MLQLNEIEGYFKTRNCNVIFEKIIMHFKQKFSFYITSKMMPLTLFDLLKMTSESLMLYGWLHYNFFSAVYAIPSTITATAVNYFWFSCGYKIQLSNLQCHQRSFLAQRSVFSIIFQTPGLLFRISFSAKLLIASSTPNFNINSTALQNFQINFHTFFRLYEDIIYIQTLIKMLVLRTLLFWLTLLYTNILNILQLESTIF